MKATKLDLTAARLREVLHYDPETGVFTWVRPKQGCKIGRAAGHTHPDGYRRITVDYVDYAAHRLAWPPETLDHVNRSRDDNRLVNLRLATYLENNQNVGLRSNNKFGHKGVCWKRASAKWNVQIWVNYKKFDLGMYSDINDAVAVRKAAEAKYHPFAATEASHA